MEAKKEFQRNFLIFTNEDRGYEMGDKPSGHVKLEVREGKGKLHATVQNLRAGYDKFVYNLYLIKNDPDGLIYVRAGQLIPGKNKAELEWSFNPRNVGESGFELDDCMLAAILVEYLDRPNDRIICPMAAYRNGRIEWRSGFRLAMLKKKSVAEPVLPQAAQQKIQIQPVHEQLKEAVQPELAEKKGLKEQMSENQQPESQPQPEQLKEPQQKQAEPEQFKEPQQKQAEPEQLKEPQQKQAEQKQKEVQQKQAEPEQLKEPQQKQAEQEQLKEPQQKQAEPEQKEVQPEQLKLEGEVSPENQQPESQPQPELETVYKKDFEQINTGCVYLNGNMCGAVVNTGAVGNNPCEACYMHKKQEQYAKPASGNLTMLKEEFDRYFEVSDPFHSRRSDYTWWRVTNPVNLNNLLYQCDIRSPLLFNPVVMMAHYKYRHLIIGIFQHKETQKQYVVCGVPGMNMVDQKPFGEMSRWVQAEGSRPRYGAFGYWLVYINPDDGKILSMI